MTRMLDRLAPDDVQALAELHRTAFPGFFLSTLGEAFLVEFYRSFLDDPAAITVVARSSDGRVDGAVVGTAEPCGFFRRLVRRRWLGFAVASLRAIASRPQIAGRLIRAVRYRGDAPVDDPPMALLSSICVRPDAQGSGLGRQLEQVWLEEVGRRRLPGAYLTTDRDDNEATNGFYRSGGWTLLDRYTTREGRRMNRYVKEWGF